MCTGVHFNTSDKVVTHFQKPWLMS